MTIRIGEEVVRERLGHEWMGDRDLVLLHALVEVTACIRRLDEEAEVEPRGQNVGAARFEEELKPPGERRIVATGSLPRGRIASKRKPKYRS